jgi:hypothetical protein
MNSDDVELSIWPGFKVHKACTTLCLHPCCGERLPTLPAYLSLQRSTLMCERHKDSNVFQKLVISRPLVPPSRPTRLPQPPPEPRIVPPEPVIKKTHCFKKQPKAKAEKFDERGKSINILSFFGGPTDIKEFKELKELKELKVQQAALAASKREDAPRRFIRRKDTGEIFGYWKNDQAYSTEDDKPLNFKSDFNRVPYSSNIKFDFTPPISLKKP